MIFFFTFNQNQIKEDGTVFLDQASTFCDLLASAWITIACSIRGYRRLPFLCLKSRINYYRQSFTDRLSYTKSKDFYVRKTLS